MSEDVLGADPQVAFDERHFDHAAEVDGGLFEPGADAAALLKPADRRHGPAEG